MHVGNADGSHTEFALHVPGAPVESLGQVEVPGVHPTVHTAMWFAPTGMQMAAGVSGQLCSSLHGS